MSKIVEKWVAGFWIDKVYVVKWEFRETPKTFIMVRDDDNPVYRDAKTAVNWKTLFLKDDEPQLFDTWEEAFDRLHSLECKAIRQLREKIDKCQDRMSLLDDIFDKMKEADLTSD
jgi:hypothetical protein